MDAKITVRDRLKFIRVLEQILKSAMQVADVEIVLTLTQEQLDQPEGIADESLLQAAGKGD